MNATVQNNSHCGIQIKSDEVRGTSGIHGTNEKCIQILAMVDQGVDERIILPVSRQF
jgi:hypothetical protein